MQRTFTFDDQNTFATLSGDYNPLHMNSVAARRFIFGTPVVHGVHSLLWALDHWLSAKTDSVKLRAIKTTFQNPIKVGDEVRYFLKSEQDGQVQIELQVSNVIATRLEFHWRPSTSHEADNFLRENPERSDCKALSADEVEQASGRLLLHLNPTAAAGLFLHLTKQLALLQIAQLLATTRLVGVECPGLHSVYSGLELIFDDASLKSAPYLYYRVAKLDKRFGLLSMDVNAPKMTGTVTALLRPPPQAQVGIRTLKAQIDSAEFARQRALIVGGSRGLGEVTAKLLATGGADVKITYCQGVEDARHVVDEITREGGSADCFSLDVLDQRRALAEILEIWSPTHLYYFATPFIAAGTKGTFSPALFQKFCNYYVIGFLETFEQLKAHGLVGVFYPSSVFIDELKPNMGEYTTAKMAGEMLCAFLEKYQDKITIHRPRLPKMATDQTASFIPTGNQDAVPILLRHLRALRDVSQKVLRLG